MMQESLQDLKARFLTPLSTSSSSDGDLSSLSSVGRPSTFHYDRFYSFGLIF